MKVVNEEKYEQSNKSDHPSIATASDEKTKVKSTRKEKQTAPLSQKEDEKCCPDKLRTFLSVLSGRPDLIARSFAKVKSKNIPSTTTASGNSQDDDWIKVKSKKKKKQDRWIPTVETVEEEDDDDYEYEVLENPKTFASSKYHESSRRYNEREEKRRQYKIRLERRAMREEYKVNRQKVSERAYSRPRRRYMLSRFLDYFSWWITLQKEDPMEEDPLHCDQESVEERANPKKARSQKTDNNKQTTKRKKTSKDEIPRESSEDLAARIAASESEASSEEEEVVEEPPEKDTEPSITEDDPAWAEYAERIRKKYMPKCLQSPKEMEKVMSTYRDSLGKNSEEFDSWFRHIECIFVLAHDLYRADNFSSVLFAFGSFMQKYTTASLFKSILDLFEETDKLTRDEVSERATPHEIREAWALARTHTQFKKIKYLIGACMTAAGCEAAGQTIDFKGIQLLSFEAEKKQANAIDVIDAMISTFTWACDTGAKCIADGSLYPILYSDQNVTELNNLLNDIFAHSESILIGNKDEYGTVNDLEKKVDDAISRIQKMKKVRPTGPTATWLQDKYAKLVTVKEKIYARNASTTMREAPFAIHISGGTAVGKSTLTTHTLHVCLKAMGLERDESRISTDDASDDYDTNIYSYLLAMIFDDVNNGRPDKQPKHIIDRLIKLFNNVAAKAIKAELSEKGVTFIKFLIGIITSNHDDFGARFFSDVPEAILRRFLHVRASVKPEYRIPGGTMLNTDHPDLNKGDLCVDVWDLKIEEVFVYDNKKGGNNYQFRTLILPPDFKGERVCDNMNLSEYMDAMVYLARKHQTKQAKLLKNCKDYNSMPFCDNCCKPPALCSCEKFYSSEIPPASVSKDEVKERMLVPILPKPPSREDVAVEALQLLSEGPTPKAPARAPRRPAKYKIVPKTPLLRSRIRSLPNTPTSLALKSYERRDINLRSTRIRREATKPPSNIHRGTYVCGKCGNNTKGHICPFILVPNHMIKDHPELLTPTSVVPSEVEERSIADTVGEVVVSAVRSHIKSYLNPLTWIESYNPFGLVSVTMPNVCNWVFRPLATHTTVQLHQELRAAISEYSLPFLVSLVPERVFNNRFFGIFLNRYIHAVSVYQSRWLARSVSYSTAIASIYFIRTRQYHKLPLTFVCGIVAASFVWFSYLKRRQALTEEYSQRTDVLEVVRPYIPQNKLKIAIGCGAFLAFMKAVHMMYKAYALSKEETEERGVADVQEIDNTKSTSWLGSMMTGIGATFLSSSLNKNTTPEEMLNRVRKANTVYCTFEREDGTTTSCHGIFVRSHVIVFPYHVFFNNQKREKYYDTLTVTAQRNTSSCSKIKFMSTIDVNTVVSEVCDMVMCFVPKAANAKDITKDFSFTRPVGNCLAQMVTCKDGKPSIKSISPHFQQTGTLNTEFYGANFYYPDDTYGLCGSPIISTTKVPAIVGMFIGACDQKNVGVMQCITRNDLETMQTKLFQLPDVVALGRYTDLPDSIYGKKLLDSTKVYERSMFATLPSESPLIVYGSTKFRPQSKSKVVKSVISDAVTEVTGVENKWGPPKMNPNWKAYNLTLTSMVDEPEPFHPKLLKRAREDYEEPLLKLAEENTDPYCRKLTLEEAIRGIPGVRFIDAIKRATSCGHPLFGPKSNEIDDDWNLSPRVLAEYKRALACYQRGERYFAIYMACLKDEAKSLTSEKVRVFQACPLVFTLLIRQYFLGIMRFLSLHPLMSECAVGINCMGPEWQQLQDFVAKYKDAILGWDYKKFDVTILCEILTTACAILLRIGEKLHYAREDLAVMSAMCTDLVNAMIDYNGTLIMVFNMNPSGNPLTVYLNSIVGALYARMGFFHCCPNLLRYRDYINSSCYGDDFTGSADEKARNFTFRNFHDFLAKHGVIITVPSKEDDIVDYLDPDQADYLKRVSNFIPEIGVSLGALDLDAIYKSWHCNLKSKTTDMREVAMSCIDSGLHEAFAHGKPVYEKMRSDAKQICAKVNLSTPSLFYSFEDRVANWRSKYLKTD